MEIDRYLDPALWQRWAGDTLALLVARIQSIDFVVQVVSIAVTGVAAAWLGPKLVRLVRRLLIAAFERSWILALWEAVVPLAVPGFWLVLLWLAVAAGEGVGLRMTLAVVGLNLLAAWVVIRLLSEVVRNALWSRVIFFTAWTVAALNILGVLSDIETTLGGVGFSYGQIHVTALNIVRALIVLIVLLWLVTSLRMFLERRIWRAESLGPALQALFAQVLKLLLPILAVLAALPVMGVSLTALTVFGGALAVGAGLGLQKTVGNLVSGVTLLLGGSIKPGDVISVQSVGGVATFGRVESIGARYVSLRTRGGVEHLIPNENLLTSGVENWTHSDDRVRLSVFFGVAYESKPREAIKLAVESARGCARVLKNPTPVCLLREFGDSSVNFELRFWINDPMNGVVNVKSDVLLGLWDRLAAAGIRIPFPQRDVHIIPPH